MSDGYCVQEPTSPAAPLARGAHKDQARNADCEPLKLHGIRIPTKEWMRKDLNIVCQPGKEGRRGLKRDYWDWANDPNRVPLD